MQFARPSPRVLACGLAVQILLACLGHFPRERPLVGDEIGYLTNATRIAAGDPAPPDFVFPPLYEHLLAATGPRRLAVEIFQTTLFFASGLLLHRLLSLAVLPRLACDTGLLLFYLDPEVAAFTQYLRPEIPHLFLMLLALFILFAFDPSPPALVLAGACLGGTLLLKSLLLPFLPVVAAAALLRPAAGGRRLVSVLWLAAGLAATTLPVAAWNGIHHGSFTIASSGTFNLWVGLNDPASKKDYDTVPAREMTRYLASAPTPGGRNAILRAALKEKTARDGAWHLLKGQLAKQYFRLLDHNSYFSDSLAGGRFDPWAPESRLTPLLRFWSDAAFAVLLVLSALGIASVTRRELGGAWGLAGLFLAFNFGLFLFLHVKTRFRIPFLPALVFFAALAVARLAGRSFAARRLVAGGALAAGFLYLAFAPL
jgi:hypothetical protein